MKLLAKRFWAWPRELRELGILGINARNLNYLFLFNRRSHYRYVDDKLATKLISREQGIPIPELYAVIERFGDLRKLSDILNSIKDFVVKPARGAGGRGVWIITDRVNDLFYTPQGEFFTLEEMRYHISTILSGLYSLEGQTDRAIIEQRIVPHPIFSGLSEMGTPDIRIILYKSKPVMAMVRLPTKASKGRANLHQGAVAAGIDLRIGITCEGVCNNKITAVHPDTGISISGIAIPDWGRVLETSIRLAKALNMGYLGIDIVIDNSIGPVILEANARPGLAIQIANRSGLKKHLK